MQVLTHSRWFHPLLLLVWIAIGTGLRLTHLAAKSPWTDEFSTLVFSLGHSFRTVPLDEAISLKTLLEPLQLTPEAGVGAVVDHLMQESTHPPAYFVLAYLWMKLFPPEGGLVSLWAARSLPALLGVVSIPAMFGLGCLTFRSRLTGQIAAAMIAVSPYGIFLAQEARHYTLAILWVIASLSCLVIAVRTIRHNLPLPLWVGFSWIGVNTLGIATHYFFTLTLCAEALVLVSQGWQQRQDKGTWCQAHWWRIYVVAVGTLVGGLVWLPAWQNNYGGELTQWIYRDDWIGLAWLDPVFQALAAWITMLVLLPVEAKALPVVLVSGAVMLIFLIWALPVLSRGLRVLIAQPKTHLAVQVLGGVILGAIALFFGLTYGLGTDLTRGARYNFVYFPAVIALLGASLAVSWNTSRLAPHHSLSKNQESILHSFRTRGKIAVALIWLMGLISGLTVVANLGYQKYYRPDLLIPIIQDRSQAPITLIATTHKTHVQIGELMGIAWEFKHGERLSSSANPQFFLAHQAEITTKGLYQTLNQLPRPLDLWLVNFNAPVELETRGCSIDLQPQPEVNGYQYQHYNCP